MTNQKRKRAGDNGRSPLTDEQFRLLDEMEFPWNKGVRHETKWRKNYQELAKFYNTHGHTTVERPSALYTWMTNQRQRRAGKGGCVPLTDEQIRLLDDIEFRYYPEGSGVRHEEAWRNRYQELAEFYKIHGHLKVETRGALYTWMVAQRQKRAGTGSRSPLTDEQIRLLDDIKFPWAPEGPRVHHEEAWRNKYQELADFYEIHGHLSVETPSTLHTWMVTQRRKRAGKEGFAPLTDEQIRLLDDIEFRWAPEGVGHEKAWRNKYHELAKFYNTHGHTTVERPSALYTWMTNQRRRRAGKGGCVPLTDEQIRLLDEIEFPWGLDGVRRGKVWRNKYQELADFYSTHGHTNVERPSTLHSWMVTQRRKRAGKEGFAPLTDEQIRLLDDIEFRWAPEGVGREEAWRNKYHELVKFNTVHGHFKVETPSALNTWMINQRHRRAGKGDCLPLTNDQIRLLDDIKFPWGLDGVRRGKVWRDKYIELALFYKVHGHLNVGTRSSQYNWIVTQRQMRAGKGARSLLTDEQIRLLDDIKFPWA